MTSATLSLHVKPFRLFTKAEAAHYCRLGKKFDTQCPVRPIRMSNGELFWDVQDLDKWIDSLKDGDNADADDIVARLK